MITISIKAFINFIKAILRNTLRHSLAFLYILCIILVLSEANISLFLTKEILLFFSGFLLDFIYIHILSIYRVFVINLLKISNWKFRNLLFLILIFFWNFFINSMNFLFYYYLKKKKNFMNSYSRFFNFNFNFHE